MTSFRVVLVTAPRGRAAERIACRLVASRLAACVNVIPSAISHYRWKKRLRRDQESLLIIKTRASKFAALERWVKTQHPYAVPEIIALPIKNGAKDYLAWLASETKKSL